jgi:hypothetical protein
MTDGRTGDHSPSSPRGPVRWHSTSTGTHRSLGHSFARRFAQSAYCMQGPRGGEEAPAPRARPALRRAPCGSSSDLAWPAEEPLRPQPLPTAPQTLGCTEMRSARDQTDPRCHLFLTTLKPQDPRRNWLWAKLCPPPNSRVQALAPHMAGFGARAFREMRSSVTLNPYPTGRWSV